MKSASKVLVIALVLAACRDRAPDPPITATASVGCVKCHRPESIATKAPPHDGVRPTACGVCHTQTTWNDKRIDHEGWKLTGAHARIAADDNVAGKEQQVKCFWCHRENTTTFEVSNKTCNGCHDADRERAVPSHEDFSIACETCHSTEDWKGAKEPPPLPLPPSTATASASVSASASVKPPPPKPPPPKKPPPKPPDVIVGPSGRILHR